MNAGFYYRHFDDSEENVACFLCNKNLDGWEEGDDAWEEHQKHAPNCALVRLDIEHNRKRTFHPDIWPHSKKTFSSLTPESVIIKIIFAVNLFAILILDGKGWFLLLAKDF